MTDPQDLRMSLVYHGIQVINDIVLRLPPHEANIAVQTLREHLESRDKQTRAPVKPPLDYEDLL